MIPAGLYYDRSMRLLKADLCAKGNILFYDFCRQHGVLHRQIGKPLVAAADQEKIILETYPGRAKANGVPVQLVDGDRAAEHEPCLRAVVALLLPTSDIINPTALVYKLHHLAAENGAQFLASTHQTGILARLAGCQDWVMGDRI